MELLDNILLGLSNAVTFQNLLYVLIGCVLGTLIGVLPGLGPLATIAMLLPFTYGLEPLSALIMLAGIYYGSQYGGSTTAILVNLPGETSSVVTVIGMVASVLIGGAVLIETVFAIPGIGELLVQSVLSKDFPVVQGVTTILMVIVIVLMLKFPNT